MSTTRSTPRRSSNNQRHSTSLVPRSEIRRFAHRIVEHFHPDKIILFGSYAYGTPTPNSDVDLLVIMPARKQVEQAGRIGEALPRRFGLDLFVRTPANLERRLRWGDCFLREIVERGKVLYEKVDRRVDKQGQRRSTSGTNSP